MDVVERLANLPVSSPQLVEKGDEDYDWMFHDFELGDFKPLMEAVFAGDLDTMVSHWSRACWLNRWLRWFRWGGDYNNIAPMTFDQDEASEKFWLLERLHFCMMCLAYNCTLENGLGHDLDELFDGALFMHNSIWPTDLVFSIICDREPFEIPLYHGAKCVLPPPGVLI